MIKSEQIVQIIFTCIGDINVEEGTNISKNLNTNLMGSDSELDSFGLVDLIVSVEEAINLEFNVSITLADEKAMSQRNSPFKNIDSLSNYIVELVN